MKANPRVGVVGLGNIGAEEIALWARAGHPTVGYDVSHARVQALKDRQLDTGRATLHLTTSFDDLSACDVLVLCLPNLSPSGELSMAAFDQFIDEFKELKPAERLIVVASTVPVGFTRELGARLGEHGPLLAHVPERFDPGRSTELGEIPRVAGATSPHALELTVELYSRLGVTMHTVDPVEVAEASKLLENSFRLVNIAFINEFAELCRRLGITAADVIDAAATKPFAFMKHQPGVGAGGTCIPTMPQYLLQAATRINLEMPILRDAVDGNDHIVKRVAAHLNDLLLTNAQRNAHVLVVGATYKPNHPDARASAALRFATELASHHHVVVYDPIVDTTRWPADLTLLRDLPLAGTFDAVVIAVKHDQTDPAALRLLSPILMDLVRGSVEMTESISTRS